MSPFEVFFGRKANSDIRQLSQLPTFDEMHANSTAVQTWKKDIKKVIDKAAERQSVASEKMVARHAAKNPPSEYSIGDEVIVKLKKSD